MKHSPGQSSTAPGAPLEFFAGVRAELPLLLGVIPFGLIFGVIATSAGLAPFAAWATSWIIFAGSAQVIAAPLLGTAPALVVVLTVFVVNLRHALYAASVAPYLKPLRPAWKLVLAYLLTDEAYAVSILHFHQAPGARDRHWFLLGSGLTLWLSWQTCTAAGIFLGAQIPASWSLDFAVPLTFIALVVPALRGRASYAAAAVAGMVSVAALGLPFRVGLILAALVGIVVGMVVEGRTR